MATRAFPPGNARGAEVFQALLQKSRDGMYDEAFFDLVEQYRQMYPLSEKTSLFLAFCAMSEGYFDIAMEQARKQKKRGACPFLYGRSLLRAARGGVMCVRSLFTAVWLAASISARCTFHCRTMNWSSF